MTDSPSPGQASNITRAEFAFIDVTTGATHGAAEAFNFLFAGGYISGTVGVYEVYASADNGNQDAWEPLQKDGTNVEVEVVSGVKNILPDAIFNAGWIKLVGPVGSVNVLGVG